VGVQNFLDSGYSWPRLVALYFCQIQHPDSLLIQILKSRLDSLWLNYSCQSSS
jgi:hypothetical protein